MVLWLLSVPSPLLLVRVSLLVLALLFALAVALLLVLLLILLLAWFAWALATLPPGSAALRVPAPAPGDPPVVRGAYHVHSRASDGTGTIKVRSGATGTVNLLIDVNGYFE